MAHRDLTDIRSAAYDMIGRESTPKAIALIEEAFASGRSKADHTTAMFVWQGFLTRETREITFGDDSNESDDWNGQIGAAERVHKCADILDKALDDYIAQHGPQDFPGVWLYEVAEPFGAWLRGQGPHVDKSLVREHADMANADWFEEAREQYAAALAAMKPKAIDNDNDNDNDTPTYTVIVNGHEIVNTNDPIHAARLAERHAGQLFKDGEEL